MSVKERRRLVVLEQVRSGDRTLKEGAGLLGLSYRQVRRVYRRFRSEGDVGLVHRLRGRAGNRGADAALRNRAVELYGQHYRDFGCTLACEYLLERHGLTVDDQTLRRWLKSADLWRRRRKSVVKRRRRERKASFGELVQIDGSHHDWFEGRGPWCVLMVMIDDATNWTWARFFAAETTVAAMTIFRAWALRHGLPVQLYPDRDSIYRVNTKAADELQARTGKRPQTQFGRAMAELGVKLTCAHSPQAKGRVERRNGLLQDRLVKSLRVEGISDLQTANGYLEQVFLPKLNARFTVEAARPTDAHVKTTEAELAAALVVKEDRIVGRDHCVSWDGQFLQLSPGKGLPSLAGKRVTVCQQLASEVKVRWRDQVVAWQALSGRPARPVQRLELVERLAARPGNWKPPTNHPWRQGPVTRRPPVGAGSATASAAPRPALRQPQPAM